MELAELLSMGKHCIATNYSGPTEFAKDLGCHLVEPEGLEKAYDGKWFLGNGKWAKLNDVSVNKFSEILKNLHDKKQSGNLETNVIGQKNSESLSWKQTSTQLIRHLQHEN